MIISVSTIGNSILLKDSNKRAASSAERGYEVAMLPNRDNHRWSPQCHARRDYYYKYWGEAVPLGIVARDRPILPAPGSR
jgi:hypothetical protein